MTPVLQSDLPEPRVGPRVFVSHSSADKKRFVEPFVRRLQERGVRVWLDKEQIRPSDSMAERVFTEGIGTADVGIVVLSRHSARSPWLKAELNVLVARKIEDGLRIIVIRLDDAAIPTMLADEYFVTVEPALDWSAQLDLIVRALREVGAAGAPEAPPPNGGVSPAARLRRMLGDPSQWIGAHERVTEATDTFLHQLGDRPRPGAGDRPGQLQDLLDWYGDRTAPLAELLAQCGYVGDPDQPRLWNRPLQRVLRAALLADGPAVSEVWERAAWYPGLRLAYAIGVAAVAGGREGVVQQLLTQQVPATGGLRPVWQVLTPHRVVDPDLARRIPGWPESCQALSTHLRTTLRPAFRGFLAEDEFAEAFERYEYLRSLLELHLSAGRVTSLGEFAWSVHTSRSLVAERIAEEVEALGASWPLLRAGAFGGAVAAVGQAQAQLLEHLHRHFF